ncbi:UNVERIFIED_CONTAM: protein indeterminate-domain 12 [Sesamum calycinum]|uniref:Protein indeterminate-domain 12 n=1 Tax=Sesamum calycinum TaxID=2727403 RepID=A0AAW2SAV5_9LAMI
MIFPQVGLSLSWAVFVPPVGFSLRALKRCRIALLLPQKVMFPAAMPNSTSVSEEPSSNMSSGPRVQDFGSLNSLMLQNSSSVPNQQPQKTKKKRNLPGNPDPDAEVIALSPKTLLATNRFVCEICNKGFQRDQNLQLHRRGHNLPWKLKQRNSKENRKRAYVCPEPTCLHHHPSRALGDLTGIKKHYCRKHGEKKWKCEKCAKIYAVQSDWKAHSKTCGTREYRCDCGTLFSRKDSFITHRAFCDALAEESARLSAATNSIFLPNPNNITTTTTPPFHFNPLHDRRSSLLLPPPARFPPTGQLPPLSATALLQKAASLGAVGHAGSTMAHLDMHVASAWQKSDDRFTRDFLGLTGDQCGSGGSGTAGNMKEVVSFRRGGVEFPVYEGDHNSVLKHHGLIGFTETCSGWGNC